ncbi:hypothetical protein MLD38_003141 [Melastoma candidum]|uniref:Uncharacterized protein n=1 Tax=Melastoma candidum TaxID=119954 RepID=A0ACB9S1A8_9MYRT|nr:hypothetical protein MLD38_003141 [Melastoma candidum]
MDQSSGRPLYGNSEDLSRISSMKSTTRVGAAAWGILREPHASHDTSLFSSSLPVLPHEKLNFTDPENLGLSVNDNFPKLGKSNQGEERINALTDFDADAIGKLLPDDEEDLLAGLINRLDVHGLPDNLDDPDEYDFFGSGGGLELDFDTQESSNFGIPKVGISDGVLNGINHYALSNGTGTVAGEHPYGEHPSRTLFVRNINSNVEDTELRSLFEQYGDIRTLYTACKHRGFVMISYYDIRAARTAMRALQNKPLRRRKLDIHFSIPKDNPSEKDINQGTLVVFNLDASVSNDELRQIFGVYGELKEIRETPHKRHHKFVEFYDVRAAEAALRALNRSEIAGKRIKLEPSRPGGARRNFVQQLSQELEPDEVRAFRHQIGSPTGSSPPGNWAQFASPREQNHLHAFSKSPGGGSPIPVASNHLSGLASILSPHLSSPSNFAAIGKDQGRISTINQMLNGIGSPQGVSYPHSHSFPEHLSTSPGPNFPLGESSLNSSSIKTLSGPQFLWGSPSPYPEHAGSSAWSMSSSAVGRSLASGGLAHGFPYSNRSNSLLSSNQSHHVGSAPGGVPMDRQIGFFPESPESSFMSSVAVARRNLNRTNGSYLHNMGPRPTMSAGIGLPGNISENGSHNFGMISLPRPAPAFYMNGSYPGLEEAGLELLADRSRVCRMEGSGNPMDSKKQYQLDLEKIIKGEDTRTTLMIKNIPNKYTSKMLLSAIDEQHKGTYDFLYLPIDFKNKCNVGYAFINMISPSLIVAFYETFNGKKWEKFNSEKVASLAYARIQGKTALVSHFQNSSLMNEDKRCRPILFHSEGQETVDQQPLFTGNLNIYIRQADGSYSGDLLESPKGDLDEKPDGS